MRFNLLDSVEVLTDQRLVAIKQVSLSEEYLADHFPSFPVLPGVMMLEALTQAAAWLLHRRSNFARSMAVLKEARNVKYGNFVAPGQSLRVDVELIKPSETGATFKASGSVGGVSAVSARIEMSYFDISTDRPELKQLNERLGAHNRTRWNLLMTTSPRLGQTMGVL